MPKTIRPSGLTMKQERFVAEYLIDCNATRAAKAAGYAERSAYRTGADMLQLPKVKEAVEGAAAKLARRLDLSAERVLADIARVASMAEAAGEFSAALKGHELLGKHLRLFADKFEHSGPDGGPIPLARIELVPMAKS